MPFELESATEKISADYVDGLLACTVDANGMRFVEYGHFNSEGSKREAEEILLEMLRRNHQDMLPVWWKMGGDTDMGYVRELQQKSGERLKELEVAVLLTELNDYFWSNSFRDVNDEESQKRIESQIDRVMALAEKLSRYSLNATHVVGSAEDHEQIIKQKILRGSGSSDYTGAGVYLGILGGYQDWKQGAQTIKTRVRLADTLPSITDKAYPQAMAVLLSNKVSIGGDTAEPIGLVRWNNEQFDNPNDWSINTFAKYLGCEVRKVKNPQGNITLVANTDKDPIIWGSLANLLHIPDVIREKDFAKIEVGEWEWWYFEGEPI